MIKEKSSFELKTEAVVHQLKLIDGANRQIEISKKMNSELMVRQYVHLKKELTKELLNILADFNLPIQMKDVA